MGDFPTFYMTPDIAADEILTEIAFPARLPGTGYAFEEFSRRHGDFAVVNVAVSLSIEGGLIVDSRVAIGGAGSVPQRAGQIERGLTGARPDEARFDEAVRLTDDVECIADIHASADYRRHLLSVLARRAVSRAARQALDAS